MQFQVPQFIEVEDKIFGPLTFKQFVFIAGGAGTCYLLWRALPLFVAAPLILGVGGLAASLAFVQYNGQPFLKALENAFFFMIRSKLYLWSNTQKKAAAPKAEAPQKGGVYVPHLSDSRLHELAWSLDIKERIAAGTAPDEERGQDSVMPIRTPQEMVSYLKDRQTV